MWSRYPQAPFVAVSHEQARALGGPERRSASSITRWTPTRIPFQADARRLPAVPRPLHRRQGRAGRPSRWRAGPGIACCSRRRRTTTTAQHVAPLVDGAAGGLRGRGAARGEGGAARRRARAALSGAGRRVVRPGAGRGRRRAARRWPRSIAAPCARSSRTSVTGGVFDVARRAGGRPAAGAGARPRRACASAPWSASASTAWSTAYVAIYRGVAERHRARA